MAQPNHEPSMEDILASIKRIIAEDSEAVGARAPRLRREQMAAVSASPLVTPQPAAEPVVPFEEAPSEEAAVDEAPGQDAAADEPEASAPAAPDPVAVTADAPDVLPDVLELTSPMPESAAKPQDAPAAESPATARSDGLLSSVSAQASRNAFAALSQMQVRAEEGQSNTLEGLVADLLKPMLREWLDRELPALVERLVSAEVSRLSGRG